LAQVHEAEYGQCSTVRTVRTIRIHSLSLQSLYIPIIEHCGPFPMGRAAAVLDLWDGSSPSSDPKTHFPCRAGVEECRWRSVDDLDVEVGLSPRAATVPWSEQIKHWLVLFRLQKPYFLYSVFCSLLAAAACLSTMVDLVQHRSAASDIRWQDILEGNTWQSACWSVVTFGLVLEVTSGVFMHVRDGTRIPSWDFWLLVDSAVLLLTFAAWILMHFRRASREREEAEEVDLWLLLLRFALQPCRVVATAKMARKVQVMQTSHMDIKFDDLDDRLSPTNPQQGAFARNPF